MGADLGAPTPPAASCTRLKLQLALLKSHPCTSLPPHPRSSLPSPARCPACVQARLPGPSCLAAATRQHCWYFTAWPLPASLPEAEQAGWCFGQGLKLAPGIQHPQHPRRARGHGRVSCGSLAPQTLSSSPGTHKPLQKPFPWDISPHPSLQQDAAYPQHLLCLPAAMPNSEKSWPGHRETAAGVSPAKAVPSWPLLLGQRWSVHICFHCCPVSPPQGPEEGDSEL